MPERQAIPLRSRRTKLSLLTACALALLLTTSAFGADFDADAVDVWISPSTVYQGQTADIYARFKNLSSTSGPYGGYAQFDLRIIVYPPSDGGTYACTTLKPSSGNSYEFSPAQTKDFYWDNCTFSEAGQYTVKAEIWQNNAYSSWSTSSSTRFDYRQESFTINVQPNRRPTSTRETPSSSTVTVLQGASQTFTVRGADADGNLDGVEWYLNGSHQDTNNMSGNSDTDPWSKTFNTAGTYTVEATVYDSGSPSLYSSPPATWTVTVIANRAPTSTRETPSLSTVTVLQGASQTFTVRGADADGNLDGVEWYLNGNYQATHNMSGNTDTDSWSKVFNAVGTYMVEATVFDSGSPSLYSSPVAIWTVEVSGGFRGLYVDYVHSLLSNRASQLSLLEYAKKNSINYLALYVSAGHPNLNPPGDTVLSEFIELAKASYDVQQVGLIGGSEADFDKYVAYNESHAGKINVLNLEMEFWNSGDFDVWTALLRYMRTVGASQSLLVEAYIGWPDSAQMSELSGLVDRLLVHAYVANPAGSYDYTRDRLLSAGESGYEVEVWPIFSGESSFRSLDQPFMGDWLKNNSMAQAESTYVTDYVSDNDPRLANIGIAGFQYYSYQVLSPFLFITATSFSPQHGSTNVDPNTNFEIAFADIVASSDLGLSKGATGTIAIKRLSDGFTVASIPITDSRIEISGNNLVAYPNVTLEPNTEYCVIIDPACVRATASGILGSTYPGISTNAGWAFTTSIPNQSPSDISLSNSFVQENRPSGATVGTLSTTDPDAGNTFTYTFAIGSGSADNSSFTIAGDQLKTAALFDYESKSSYSIRIRTTDQGGLWDEKIFIILVNDVKEALKGDLNNDGQIDLEDALIALRVLSGLQPQVPINLLADVNSDGKIGMEEVLYALRKTADIIE